MKYYAKLTTPEGKEVDLSHMINEDGEFRAISLGLSGSLVSNAVYIDCRNNQLTSINAPNAHRINCRNNQLTSINAPNAHRINCNHNHLIIIFTPNAQRINCNHNQLRIIFAPYVEYLDCAYNQLTSIDAPNAKKIFYYKNPLSALVKDCGKEKQQIWSQKVDDVIYTYINGKRFTLKEAIAAINEEYEGKEAADYIEKVKLSQSKAV